MTLLITTETADRLSVAEADVEAEGIPGPGCGCCLPPPGATADKGLGQLLARRERLERRLQRLEAGSRA